MRKIVAATVTLALAGALAACGGKSDADNTAVANDAALNEIVAPDEGNLPPAENDAALLNDTLGNDTGDNLAAVEGNAL